MKMIKESNKKTYIIWTVIIVLIIAVILFFVLPKTDSIAPFNNCVAVSTNTNEKDNSNLSIDGYCVQVLSYSEVSSSDKTTISNLVKLQSTLQLSDNFNRTALAFLNNNNNYKTLMQEQNALRVVLMSKIDAFQLYCKTTLTTNLQTLPNAYNTAEIMQVFIEKYKDLVVEYSNFYLKTAQLIENSAIKCIEVNELVITANKNISTTVSTILASGTLNATQIGNLLITAETQYSPSYYQTYFD